MTTTTTMTLETAGYVIRCNAKTPRERQINGEALTVLGRAGWSDHDVAMQAQRELRLSELITLGQARVA